MPPWAQTECERLTGTMENRSTLPPASAILMTAASPARPPPITMILGAAIVYRILSDLQSRQPRLWRNFQDARAGSEIISFTAEGIGGVKRNGAGSRFQKLIWLIAVVRIASSCSENCAETRE